MYTIKKVKKERINKSGYLKVQIYETLPLMRIGESFNIPLKDFKGPLEEFQKTVCAIICIYVAGKSSEKFQTHLDKKSREIEVTRVDF